MSQSNLFGSSQWISNQLNRLPRSLVGALFVVAFIILAIASIMLLMIGWGFVTTHILSLPFGIGAVIIGIVVHLTMNLGDQYEDGKSVDKSVFYQYGKSIGSQWIIALVLGNLMLALFPQGQHILSQFYNVPFSVRSIYFLWGMQTLALGWALILLTRFSKPLSRLGDSVVAQCNRDKKKGKNKHNPQS